MAPAIAVPAKVDDMSFWVLMDFKEVNPFGRFWMDKREVGLEVGLVGLWILGVLVVLKHLALRIAIVAMVAAIGALHSFFFLALSELRLDCVVVKM